jgi:Putative peptidoglycan binding domain/L,D-transpeptidase catalytic domain
MWQVLRRHAVGSMFVALLCAVAALGYGVDTAATSLVPKKTQAAALVAEPAPERAAAWGAGRSDAQAAPAQVVIDAGPPLQPKPVAVPGPRLLGAGDSGARVRVLQARLRQIGWYLTDVTGAYGDVTTAAVRGFQAKRHLPVTGYVDRRTLDRLEAMTSAPSADELHNRVSTTAALDPRCTTGRALCIDKTTRTLRWVVAGRVLRTVDVRFGAWYSPTREGLFHVEWKDAAHVSHLYGSSMPWAMFFSRGQAVHYSSDFAARGYLGASHGCVNVRDLAGIEWLFSHVEVGDKVVIYWS